MSIDTFLFDLDGTLVDSVTALATAVNLLRAELSLPPLGLATVRTYVGDGATALVQRALPAGLFSPKRLGRFLALYGEHLLESTLPYPGIVPFLRFQAQRGARMAVVTNKPYRLTLPLLAGLGLDVFFPVVIGGDSCREKKPHPEPVVQALRGLGADAAMAVMIGDHRTDLAAGRAAGIRTCFCAWGIGHDGGLPADFRAAEPDELLRLFPAEAP